MTDQDPAAAPAAVPSMLAATYVAPHRHGFLTRSGMRLRHASWNVPGTSRGTVVVLTGRGEFIEKYATEVVGELLGRGYGVFAMDWRGQGLSDRALPDRDKGHIDGFATYVDDLRTFLDTVVVPQAAQPILVLAHSMGAHITMRALAENGSSPLAAAVLVSPMTGLRQEILLRSVLTLLPSLPFIERRYLFGSGPFVAADQPFDGNVLTHDERRYRFTEQWFAADPRLSLGGPTFGWARQAVRSMIAARAPGYLERIGLPVLLLSADGDPLVDPRTHRPAAARLRCGDYVGIDGARHEILMETDAIRAQFWDAFDRFAKTVAAA